MAVIDQDNFSNISWHSDQNIRVGSSASAEHEGHDEEGAGSKSHQDDVVDRAGLQHLDPSHGGDEILECTVTDPHTENAGTKDAYVSYLITTHVGPRPSPSLFPASLLQWLDNPLIIAAAVHLPLLPEANLPGAPALHRLWISLQDPQ